MSSVVNDRPTTERNLPNMSTFTSPDPGSSKPGKLKSRQRCYVCFDYMPIGWLAYFNSRNRKWRHTGCDDPNATSGWVPAGSGGRR